VNDDDEDWESVDEEEVEEKTLQEKYGKGKLIGEVVGILNDPLNGREIIGVLNFVKKRGDLRIHNTPI
jgi:hypothetical protein